MNAYELPEWPELMLLRMQDRPVKAPELPEIRPGSLWLSISTARRASVLWSSGGRVCLSYSEDLVEARKTHTVGDFLRLYQPVS